MVVRILDDLPEFVCPDRTYALSREDVVTLPVAVAKLLIKGKKAAEIAVRQNIN